MAKRKNPLKDLDSFLNQEASSFVEPEKVEEAVPALESAPQASIEPSAPTTNILDKSQIIAYLKALSDKDPIEFRNTLYEIIQRSLENGGVQESSDKMLVNTVLYLNNQTDWKEVISAYWKAM